MYFNKNNSFNHGIMFHHFHDKKLHLKTQGSINKKKLKAIIDHIGKENIVNPDTFINLINKKKRNKDEDKKVCFTFDDGLLCQYDIAGELLYKYGIKSFYFIYSSILDNKPDLLEIYRYYRVNFFKNINSFYSSFFYELKFNLDFYFNLHQKLILNTKKKFPFYSYQDIKFRLIRDHYLSAEDYNKIMKIMMARDKFNYRKFYKKLFLNKLIIKKLIDNGDEIGLHSHTHPTRLEDLSYKEQEKEYNINKLKLENLLNSENNMFRSIRSMSHPCGSYNADTLSILRKLNIKIGFKQIMGFEKDKFMNKVNNSNLEIARIDHALLVRQLKL